MELPALSKLRPYSTPVHTAARVEQPRVVRPQQPRGCKINHCLLKKNWPQLCTAALWEVALRHHLSEVNVCWTLGNVAWFVLFAFPKMDFSLQLWKTGSL